MKKILEIYSKGLFSTLDESLCKEVLVLFGDLGSSNYETNLKSLASVYRQIKPIINFFN